ncbi:hypothetical protein GW17_00062162 [Ensete ventricosum]|nr:hypothetical protein GW17_00062162 [Ensete ventricosum]RZR88419.1 hypothetical protein BHM03_00015993 [Ensete ventricosum]
MIRSEGSEEGGSHLQVGPLQGRPPTAKPPIRVTDCSQSPFRGSRTWPRSPARASTHGQTLCNGDQAARGSRLRPGAAARRNDR